MAFHLKEARDLGEITYGDEHVHKALILSGFSTPRKLPWRPNLRMLLIASAQMKFFA